MRAMAFCLIFLAIAAACSAALDPSEGGRQALMEFFRALESGHYSQAVERYGGSYQVLRDMNPDLPPDGYESLWEHGCTLNGLQCLPIRSATFKERVGDTFIYTVEFTARDGGRFGLGPCCGADPTLTPPVYSFEYRVALNGGQYLVLDLPPYLP